MIFHRNRAPIDVEVLQEALHRLKHRGWDGHDHQILPELSIGLGHQHAWITPEETGERQPVCEAGRYILLDGRIDNRAEILHKLGLESPEGHRLSDAVLILRAFEIWGEACFDSLIGSYAAALIDSREHRIILARDAVGERTLYYYLDATILVAASEPHAVLAHPVVLPKLDEDRIVRWYAVKPNDSEMTFFESVTELRPAQLLSIDANDLKERRTWDPHIELLRYRSDEEYGEHFRSVLEESIRARMRATGPISVQMSGGYDSTSIAAMAASISPKPLHTISWVFDELKEANEQPYIQAVEQYYNMHACYVCGDESWPFRDPREVPLNPSYPLHNGYHILAMQIYQAATQHGSRVVLTGEGGDHVFAGYDNWLINQFREGGLLLGIRTLITHTRKLGMQRLTTDRAVRSLGRTVVQKLTGMEDFSVQRKHFSSPDWLTSYAAQKLQQHPPSGEWMRASVPRPDQLKSIMSGWTGGAAGDASYYRGTQIQLEHPYRDRRLIEFMLAVPSNQLFNGTRYKYIIYHSMKSLLPERVRQRTWRSSLTNLYHRGRIHGIASINEILFRPDAFWPYYINQDAIKALIANPSGKSEQALAALWMCYAMELWLQYRHP